LEFDVAIIGASSSGLFLAEKLASGGFHVGVFEREKELKPARRTYIITPHLDHVFGGAPEELILHRIRTMAVETARASVNVPLRNEDLIVERAQLIRYLVDAAEVAGAEIHLGHRFIGFGNSGISTDIELRDARGDSLKIRAKTLIGSDGAFSEVAKAAGIRRPDTVPLMQAEIALPEGWDPALTKVWFDADETRFFYWLIPESDQRAVVGLIANETTDSRQILARFLAKYEFEVLAFQAGQAAMHQPGLRPWSQVGDLNVILVGDAAGQVKVTTVGGTVTGFWGARAAADALLNGSSYARNLRPLKRELDLHWFIRLLLERLDNQGYGDLIEAINENVIEFLGQRNRDEMAGAFWKLAFLQPRFIGLGLRLLLNM